MAQSVKCLISAQVMISHFVSLSPASGSVLTAQSLEPASDSVSPSLSAPPPLMLALSLSLSPSNINKNIKKIQRQCWETENMQIISSLYWRENNCQPRILP